MSSETSEDSSRPIEIYDFDVDGTLYHITSYHDDITVNSINYVKQLGLKRSVFSLLNSTKEPFVITIPITSQIAQLCCLMITPKIVKVTFYRYQKDDLTKHVYKYEGELQAVSVDKLECQMKFPNIFETALGTSIPKFATQPNCNWRLSDKNCKKDIGPYILSFDYTRGYLVTSEKLAFNAAGIYTGPSYGIDLLKGGVLETDTLGIKEFRSITEVYNSSGEIATSSNTDPIGQIDLSYSLQVFTVDTKIKITPGCNNAFSTCKDRWNNHLNFGGFPTMPTEKINPFLENMKKTRRI